MQHWLRILIRSSCTKSSLNNSSFLIPRTAANIKRKLNTMADNEMKEDVTDGVDVDMEGLSTKFQLVKEGKAKIIQPTSVFYNPVQEFNRDLTIAIISEFAEEHVKQVKEKRRKRWLKENPDKEYIEDEEEALTAGEQHSDGLKILEGLSASGLRSMRFGLEIPGVNKIIANDFDKHAVEVIDKNIKRNKLEHLVEASHNDAAMLMYQNRKLDDRFDVIDLDPYGTPGPFLDAAVQSVRDGGLLCITCTDGGTLCGNFGEKAFTMYGSLPLRSKYCHEMALRIILRSIESHAATYSRYIVPLLSLSVDFYFRLFVRVYSGQYQTKFSASHTGMVYQCTGCGSFSVQPLCEAHPAKGDTYKFVAARGPPVGEKCEHCGYKHQIGGPIYLGPLHNVDFVEKIISRAVAEPEKFNTSKRIEGMLSVVSEEIETPLYYEADGLYQVLHCSPPKLMDVRSAILNAGYKVTFSHACKNSLKTNAPNRVIWDIMRAWIAKNPVKRSEPGSSGHAILSVKPSIEVNFEPHPDANPRSRSQNLVRWQPNPERNWGPKPRAKKSYDCDTLESRRLKNQGKRKRKAEEELVDDSAVKNKSQETVSAEDKSLTAPSGEDQSVETVNDQTQS
ncbi:tRNA (guanine(26)-N(2))-dimethyltransferase-like [Mercenaria mercenaria]|uniref:tRNA (guanine(26)-N(2))-dimethyltransferase-like n=1 Tax=Mercenaria mercenaria TaxID=6596 RepID=UPI00234E4BB6|nr:tRNA (guanine(26)-N(2))-dimethyltransferase-like [Mercenaria mercenaria]XP_053405444.1 tRNA (guanine(26)-N(2))-dimethyltransferase-like [Mercenaria mercenaria]XP_053405445.1 tRNA (guanine(26)-N(2))-dimethyltransferase-like [Mercenaria mercenaria]